MDSCPIGLHRNYFKFCSRSVLDSNPFDPSNHFDPNKWENKAQVEKHWEHPLML